MALANDVNHLLPIYGSLINIACCDKFLSTYSTEVLIYVQLYLSIVTERNRYRYMWWSPSSHLSQFMMSLYVLQRTMIPLVFYFPEIVYRGGRFILS